MTDPTPPDIRAAEPPIRPRRVLVLLPLLVFAGLAGLFALRLASGGDPSTLPSALIGHPAPPAGLPPLDDLKTQDGTGVPGWSGAELKAGQVTIVNVWASWCAPCKEEHATLMGLKDKAAGVRLVGLNYKDTPENARRFLGAFGNPFAAVGMDRSGATAIEWGVYGVPETFIVGRDGRIRFKQVGPLTPANLPAFLDQLGRAQAS